MGNTVSQAWGPCEGCTAEGLVPQPGAGREGLGRLFGVKAKLSLKGGCVGRKLKLCASEGRHFRQRETEPGGAAWAQGERQAVRPPELCISQSLVLSEVLGIGELSSAS